MLSVCQRNQLTYRYVLADSWFSAKENLHFIRQGLGKHFVLRQAQDCPEIQPHGGLEL